jgi:hypothetical protein
MTLFPAIAFSVAAQAVDHHHPRALDLHSTSRDRVRELAPATSSGRGRPACTVQTVPVLRRELRSRSTPSPASPACAAAHQRVHALVEQETRRRLAIAGGGVGRSTWPRDDFRIRERRRSTCSCRPRGRRRAACRARRGRSPAWPSRGIRDARRDQSGKPASRRAGSVVVDSPADSDARILDDARRRRSRRTRDELLELRTPCAMLCTCRSCSRAVRSSSSIPCNARP